jgi:hypothetical protein
MAPPSPASAGNSLDDLVQTVRQALKANQTDIQLAKALHKLNLREKLDARTAEELESEVPGPKSIAELEDLRDVTRDLPPPVVLPWFASPFAPSTQELREILRMAARKAFAYTANLPDFICAETVRRYESMGGRGGWVAKDTLTLQLTYFDQGENYKLIAMNGHKTELTYEETGGALSKGEFGSMLYSVFEPKSKTEFTWSNWTTLRKRPAYVISFRIAAVNSGYRLTVGRYGGGFVTTIPGEHGLLYIDRETKDAMRLDCETDTIPADFPLASATRTLDYGPADVGGSSFLLPLHADVRMTPRDRHPQTRNVVDFTGYRKFVGETSISFEDPAGAKPPAPPEKNR